jgi:aspartyl-tRNA(Asn)/glutamyl-tRNA(Gln) amidotransferase subunit A
LKYSIPAYYIAAVAEASTNLAKFSGMRYGAQDAITGTFNEYYSKVRSANLSDEAKRRILIGTFARMAGFRDAYYIKALKIRTKIIQEYKQIFKNFDCIITPSMPCIAPKFSKIGELDPLEVYQMDLLTVGPNVAGLPHMSVNVGYHKSMPIGMTIIADHFNEDKVLQIGNTAHII